MYLWCDSEAARGSQHSTLRCPDISSFRIIKSKIETLSCPAIGREHSAEATGKGVQRALPFGMGLGQSEAQRRGLRTARVPNKGSAAEPLADPAARNSQSDRVRTEEAAQLFSTLPCPQLVFVRGNHEQEDWPKFAGQTHLNGDAE
jgi:hypothetical protein